jgi:RNA polymerase sigma factor (sigma-70 family)
MEEYHPLGVAEEDSDPTPEEVLVQYDSYIVALVGIMTRTSSNLSHLNLHDQDISEIEQQVRIKFWNALRSRHIVHLKSYIRQIVQNEIIDMIRRWKPTLPLQINDDGELYMGDVAYAVNEELANPEVAFIDEESFEELLERTATAIAILPPRQQKVLICRVRDTFGNHRSVIKAFARHSINIEMCCWPENESESKLLKASHSVARKKMKQILNLVEKEYQVCQPLKH